MTLENYINEIKLRLTGDVLDLEVEDATLIKIINSALREIQRYYDEVSFITVPFKSCINLNDVSNTNGESIKVSSVVNVIRSDALSSDTEDGRSSLLTDPMSLISWQILGGSGNISYTRDYVYNYLAYSTALQIRNTVSTDMSNFYNKAENSVYINCVTSRPSKVTILYVPQLENVEQIQSDYWIDIMINLSIAIAKKIIGTIRTKYKQSNALWQINGDQILSEGINEYTEIITHLKDNHDLVYGID